MQAVLHSLAAFAVSASVAGSASAQPTIPPPGQPSRKGTIGSFEIIGNSLVSAQQIFVGTPNTVYFVDKAENNPSKINDHPAWASEWNLGSDKQRPMEVVTNSFCAGGNVLGNGTWMNVGGNQAVTYGGDPASQDGDNAFGDADGRQSIRLLDPCDDGQCDWNLSPDQVGQRWYPTLETLDDGTMIILGGCSFGGYVNSAFQDNPTYEFFPQKGGPITSDILSTTLPVNLYPLTWLLPSSLLLVQSNWKTVLLNHTSHEETPLDDIPDAVRVYPASAGVAMLPLTPANNYTATIIFCGGSDVQPGKWQSSSFIVPTQAASASCVKLTPDVSGSYTHDDPLPEGRSMLNFILLPNGKIFGANGASMGTAGYGNDSWAIGQSYADNPVLMPLMYDPDAPAGQRFSQDGLTASTIPRMYHSSATLLPDGSVLISGSNPNSDYNVGPDIKYPTEYRTELFYPSYYNERRPEPKGLISQLSYGGPTFDIQLDSTDLFGDINNVKEARVVIIRTGFSTHAINMGQRYLQLESTYTGYSDNNTATLHVRQMPPNPSLFAPGPAYMFVVVNGIPSIGQPIMIGSGKLEKQIPQAEGDLPSSLIQQPSSGKSQDKNGASPGTSVLTFPQLALWTLAAAFGGFAVGW